MAVTTKYVVRQDATQVQILLDTLQRVFYEIQRLIAGEFWRYRRGSTTRLCVNRDQQIKALLELRNAMLNLIPQAVELGVQVSSSPSSTLNVLLNLQ